MDSNAIPVEKDNSNNSEKPKEKKAKVIPSNYLLPFILVTSLFALWGFANDITNPMVAAFKTILLTSNFQSSLVQFAFYGGYCVMAIPAAIFIKRFTYKTGLLVGLFLYASGALLFVPSGMMMAFPAFLISYFIMTCGLSFLETSSNPYILAMGPEDTSTQRLNFAQSFNPMGSITGMLIASQVILISLNPTTETGRKYMQDAAQGKLYHTQLQAQSIGMIKAAQDKIEQTVKQTANLQQDQQALSEILTKVDGAKNLLVAMQPQVAEQAAKLKPQLAEQGLLKEKRIELRESLNKLFDNPYYGSDNELKDSAALIENEIPVLKQVAPEKLQTVQQTTSTVAAELSSVIAALEKAKKTQDSEPQPVDQAAIQAQLAAALGQVQDSNAVMATVSGPQLQDFFAAVDTNLQEIQKADLQVVIGPYMILGFVVLGALVLFFIVKLPKTKGEEDNKINLRPTLKRLFSNKKYLEGVVAQAFYVGAQIMCWTFIIQYAEYELGIAKEYAQLFNVVAMMIFVSSRFICTFLLKFFSPGGLLMTLAIGGFALIIGTIFIQGNPNAGITIQQYVDQYMQTSGGTFTKFFTRLQGIIAGAANAQGLGGLFCLIGVSACMSLMFPTIYGIALKGLGDDAKLGAAGLIMAIGGGSIMPPMQAWIMDQNALDFGFMTLSSVRASFVLPLICFVVIAIFGFRTSNVHGHKYQ